MNLVEKIQTKKNDKTQKLDITREERKKTSGFLADIGVETRTLRHGFFKEKKNGDLKIQSVREEED